MRNRFKGLYLIECLMNYGQRFMTLYRRQWSRLSSPKKEMQKGKMDVWVQFSSVTQLCPTIHDAMDCSTPGFPVYQQPPEFAQTHVHRVSDAPSISHSVMRFSSRLQSFPASGSFQMSHFFPSGGQRIGISASVLPMNIQGWFPLGLTGWSMGIEF